MPLGLCALHDSGLRFQCVWIEHLDTATVGSLKRRVPAKILLLLSNLFLIL